jgi:hypothetical protein
MEGACFRRHDGESRICCQQRLPKGTLRQIYHLLSFHEINISTIAQRPVPETLLGTEKIIRQVA